MNTAILNAFVHLFADTHHCSDANNDVISVMMQTMMSGVARMSLSGDLSFANNLPLVLICSANIHVHVAEDFRLSSASFLYAYSVFV